MGIIKNKEKSLTRVIAKQFLMIIIEEILLIIIFLMINASLVGRGIIQYANYTENYLKEHKQELEDTYPFDASKLPNYCTYGIFDINKQYIEGTFEENDIDDAKDCIDKAGDVSGAIILLELQEGYCVVKYDIVAHFTNPNIDKYFPNVELEFGLIILIVAFIIILLNAILLTKRLKKELLPLEKGIEHIKQRDLDYEISKSDIKEFNEILQAQWNMKEALAKSLKAEWETEQRRKENISALAHDIKTPLTIIKGNAELMEEDHEYMEEIESIKNNADKIERYIRLLIDEAKGKKEEHNDEIEVDNLAENIKKEIEGVCKTENIPIIIKKDTFARKIWADEELISRAIMNIVTNAIEHTDKNKGIVVSFMNMEFNNVTAQDLNMENTSAKGLSKRNSTLEDVSTTQENDSDEIVRFIKIKVEDFGKGFTKEALKHYKEQFFTERVERSNEHYGLGMYFANTVAEKYKGEIQVYNKEDGSGAVVTFKVRL